MTQNTTIAFSAPKKWTLLSWGIKKFTKSKVSHVLIGTQVKGVDVYLHCTGGGVKVSRQDNYLKTDNVLHEFPLTINDHVQDKALAHAWGHIDDNYDYAGIFGFAWVIVAWQWLKRKVRNPVASPSSMWCSEFVLHLNLNDDHKYGEPNGTIPEWNDLHPEYTHCQHLLDRIKPGEGSFGPGMEGGLEK
jgi:hypothetical protein